MTLERDADVHEPNRRHRERCAREITAEQTVDARADADGDVLLRAEQPRVAKLEAGDGSVSIELLMRALLSLGASKRQIGAMIAQRAA